jgi:DNA-binding transcriptional LysR family regulator
MIAMAQVSFDLDVMRTFVTGTALGSYARAADRLGRSTSAVSAQLRKLEAQAGTSLFRKSGRGLELTEAGETLLAYARRLLDLNDEASAAVRGVHLQGAVRLGLQEDLGESLLPATLGRFARAHPRVQVEVSVANSAGLRDRLAAGLLDLALMWDVDTAPVGGAASGSVLAQVPLQWVGPAQAALEQFAWWRGGAPVHQGGVAEPLPLVMLEGPCLVRDIVTAALDRAGMPWRRSFSSSSLSALWAAVSAGLGLAVRTSLGLPFHVRGLDLATAAHLPPLPSMPLTLHCAQMRPEAQVAELATLLRDAVRDFAASDLGD